MEQVLELIPAAAEGLPGVLSTGFCFSKQLLGVNSFLLLGVSPPVVAASWMMALCK